MKNTFYKELVKGFSRQLNENMRNEVADDKLLSRINKVVYTHGKKTELIDVEGQPYKSEAKPVEASYKIQNHDFLKGDKTSFRSAMNKTIGEMRNAVIKGMFKTIDDVTNKTGNKIDMKGQPLTPEVVCEMFERVEISFDKDGNPEMPTICISPGMERTVREMLERPEVQLRIDCIIRRKWLERYSL